MFKLLQVSSPALSLLDWIVLLIYGAGMLGIGWYYQRKNKTKEEYLLGGRKMKSTSVGISLFATLLSTLSYLTYPGEMIQHGPIIFAGSLAFPLVYFIVGWWIIPAIMKTGVTSAYEILEQKLGLSVRLLGTVMFLSLRLLWMATIIYVTVDVALYSVIQFNKAYVPLIAALLTVVTIIYTTMGGLKAVVVTDIIQSAIFLGGALLSVMVVCWHFGSVSAIIPEQWPQHWNTFKIGFDPLQRTTMANAMLSVLVWYVCTNGSDQIAVQRYLATPDVKAARRSFKIALMSDVFASTLLALVGLSMLAYFTNNSSLLNGKPIVNQADTLFPRFILIGLPAGVSGLVIAGLLAAAMSSLSSGLNSVSSVVSEDLISRFRKNARKEDALRQIKRLSLVTGIVILLLSFIIARVQGNLLDVIMKVVNLFVAPLFVLFFMALFVPFATKRGTFLGGILAVGIAVAIAFWEMGGITVLWIMPVSLMIGVVGAMCFSVIDRSIKRRLPV
ncbi:sodium/solute symporter [Agriterribacter sp.]|uniref:sodium:solute symporter family transporter n=1 Tax=Agriterribacter sp. TaxID=2821509 RepID=UPI002B88314E|nr:sodium/solute symporter [Agriterribacter sp.]HRP57607.1 sodium/solute symporter [Agriterribacter sp.]